MTLLPLPDDGIDRYHCTGVVSRWLIPRTDLRDTPLEHPDLIRFVDGSYAKNVEGKYQAGYAVTSYELLERAIFPQLKSAQPELHALAQRLSAIPREISKHYTNSTYAFDMLQKQRVPQWIPSKGIVL